MGMPSIWEAEARDNKFEVSLDCIHSYSLLSKKSEEKERIVFKDKQQQKPIGFDL